MAIEQKINYADFVTPGMRALATGQRAQAQFGTLADMAGLQLAKDVALEDRAQERERLRLAAQQREMLKGARDKAQRKSTIGDITSLIGSGLGFVYGGGPAGAAAGGAAGRTLGTLFAQEGGSVPNFVPSPTGKFRRSGYEQLVRDQEYLIDLEKAIQKAQKPTAGTLLGAAAKGYTMGKGIGSGLDMLKSANIGQRLNMFLTGGQGFTSDYKPPKVFTQYTAPKSLFDISKPVSIKKPVTTRFEHMMKMAGFK